jgi:hypothetical protein
MRAVERGEPATDQQWIPAAAVLIEQQHGAASRIRACMRARRLNLHQRDKAMHFALIRYETAQHTAKPQRFLA